MENFFAPFYPTHTIELNVAGTLKHTHWGLEKNQFFYHKPSLPIAHNIHNTKKVHR
jgi:hypothetical protein